MVIAGHETVAAALAWTLMLLAEHQPAQDRVRAELAAHPGPVSLLGHRDRLPWTRAVVDEALRLFPPAWTISRRSSRADVIGGHAVPAGTMVIISPGSSTVAATPGPTRWPSGRKRFLDAGRRALGGLPALRAGTAPVHRARVRARRDGPGAEPAPVAPPARPCRRAGPARPRRHRSPCTRGRHAARRHPGVRSSWLTPSSWSSCCAAGAGRSWLLRDLRTVPRRLRAARRRPRCRW